MNILCFYPTVQKILHTEVRDIIGSLRHPTLKDQDQMPYLRATILEVNGFVSLMSVAPTQIHTYLQARQIHNPQGFRSMGQFLGFAS